MCSAAVHSQQPPSRRQLPNGSTEYSDPLHGCHIIWDTLYNCLYYLNLLCAHSMFLYGDSTEAWPLAWRPPVLAGLGGGRVTVGGIYESRVFAELLICNHYTCIGTTSSPHWITVHCPAPRTGNYSTHYGTWYLQRKFPCKTVCKLFCSSSFRF